MKQSEVPDAVLLDVMMPGLDGMATLRALKASRPEAQVIMLSGRNQASTIVEAVQAGATDYVVKPDDPEGLGEIALDVAIKNAIEKNRLVSELSELRQQLSDDEDQAVWGNSDEHAADRDGDRAGRRQRRRRADPRRERRRQGARVARDPPAVDAPQPAVRQGQLRGAAGRAARERALRPRERAPSPAPPTTRIGKFEQADGGTLMLDEIGEMTPALQAKLLHVLQDAEFTKLGSNKRVRGGRPRRRRHQPRPREDDARAAASARISYYRLRVIEVTVPPLRERRDEIPTLIESFIARYSRKYKRPAPRLSPQLRQLFLQYDWPGNIRELENMIKRLVILQDEQIAFAEIERSMRRVARRLSRPRSASPSSSAAGVAGVPRPRSAWVCPTPGWRSRWHRLDERRSDGAARPSRPTSSRRLAGDGGQGRGDEGRARPHREDADPGALEPPQGLADTRGQLQDAAEQNQGVRHHPRLTVRSFG